MLFTKNNMFAEYEGFYYLPYGFVEKNWKQDGIYYPSGIYNILMNNDLTIYEIFHEKGKIDMVKQRFFGMVSIEDKELKNILTYNAIIPSFSSVDVFRLTKNDMNKLKMIAVVG